MSSSESSSSDSDSDDPRNAVQSDLAYLRSTKSVASKLQIFNQLVNQATVRPYNRSSYAKQIQPSSAGFRRNLSATLPSSRLGKNIPSQQSSQYITGLIPEDMEYNEYSIYSEDIPAAPKRVFKRNIENYGESNEMTNDIPLESQEIAPRRKFTKVLPQPENITVHRNFIKEASINNTENDVTLPKRTFTKSERFSAREALLEEKRQHVESDPIQDSDLKSLSNDNIVRRAFVRPKNDPNMEFTTNSDLLPRRAFLRDIISEETNTRKNRTFSRNFTSISEPIYPIRRNFVKDIIEEESNLPKERSERRKFIRTMAPMESLPSEIVPVKRIFRKQSNRSFGENSAEKFRRDPIEGETRQHRVFKKNTDTEIQRRIFKRSMILTTGLDIDAQILVGTKGISVEELNFEKEQVIKHRELVEEQQKFLLEHVEHEQEKLNQAKRILEEVREKLEEERKLLAKDQAKFLYDREELNVFYKKLQSQKEIQESTEEERQNYEKEISEKNMEIKKLQEKLEETQSTIEEITKKKDFLQEELDIEKKKSENIESNVPTFSSELLEEKLKLEAERMKLEQEKSALSSQIVPEGPDYKSLYNDLLQEFEKEKKRSRQLKADLRKVKKENIQTLELNKELLHAISKRDTIIMNIEKSTKKQLQNIKKEIQRYFQSERDYLNQERISIEEFNCNVLEPIPPLNLPEVMTVEELIIERNKLISERMKINIVKRYLEEDRKRFAEVKAKFEEERKNMTTHNLSAISLPPVVITMEEFEVRPRKKRLNKNQRSATTREGKRSEDDKSGSSRVRSKVLKKKGERKFVKRKTEEKKTDLIKSDNPDNNEERDKRKINFRGDSNDTWKPSKPRPVGHLSSGVHREESFSKHRRSIEPEEPSEDHDSDHSMRSNNSTPSGSAPASLTQSSLENGPFPIGDANPFNIPIEEIEKLVRMGEADTMSLIFDPVDHEIISGSLRGIVMNIGSKDNGEGYIVRVMLTHDYFVSAVDLIKALTILYRSPIVPSIVEPKDITVYRTRLLDVISIWISLRYESLVINNEWMRIFEEFVTFLQKDNPQDSTALTAMWSSIESQVSLQKARKLEVYIHTNSDIAIDEHYQILSFSAQQLAQQLTLVEQMYFQNTNVEEYFEKAWEDDNGRVPNLTTLLERFGEVCYWVATEVITASDRQSNPSAKYRAQTISRFIHTMNELALLRNFNSVMQIYAGLTLPVVGRMKNTWRLVPKADKDIMNRIGDLMGCQNDYKNYKNTLEAITDTPCLPFISLLLRDLTFVEEEQTYLQGMKINFYKMSQLSNIFAQIQDWKLQLYFFEEDPDIQAFLNSKIIKNKDELEQIVTDIIGDDPNERLIVDSELLGDDILGELDKFDPETPTVETFCDSLVIPEIYSHFHDWLSTNHVDEVNCLECWQTMYEYFKKADFGESEYATHTLRETAEDIYYLYLQSSASKYIGPSMNEDSIGEIIEKLNSEIPIKNNLFDKIIDECCIRLEDSWNEYKNLN